MTFVDDLTANSQLHWSDYLVLIIYFLVVIGVGIWVRDLSYYYHVLYVKYFIINSHVSLPGGLLTSFFTSFRSNFNVNLP